MHERAQILQYAPDVKDAIRKKRVCAYARVSSERDEAFHSLSSQISYYQKKIANHPDWEYVGVYADRGITGTKDARPQFQEMLTACRKGEIDIILAKSITRFARNTVILLETVRELKSLGIDIHFEEERIETLSKGGELMLSILAARAQEESRSASENQLWRIRKCYEKGIPVTGNCLGYRMVDHQFLIDDEEESTVKHIFDLFNHGIGPAMIAKQLTRDGIKNRFGKIRWSATTIRQILRNEKYCGDLKLQKKYVTDYITKKSVNNHGERPAYYVKDAHDSIISKEDFEKTQEEIRKRSKNVDVSKIRYPFSHFILCEKCGRYFGRRRTNSGSKYSTPSWGCNTSAHYGKDYCDMTQKIPEHILVAKTCEALGIPKLDETVMHEKLKEIRVPEENTLIFSFKDGSEKRTEWKFQTRRESWTPEMKEAARKRAYEQHRAKKEGGKENGS